MIMEEERNTEAFMESSKARMVDYLNHVNEKYAKQGLYFDLREYTEERQTFVELRIYHQQHHHNHQTFEGLQSGEDPQASEHEYSP